MSPRATEDPVVRATMAAYRPLLGDRVRRVVLFGSRARGDATEESDYDVLVVVDRRDEQLVEALYRPVMDVLLGTGKLVSLKVMSEQSFERLRGLHTPFIEAVLRDGVVLG